MDMPASATVASGPIQMAGRWTKSSTGLARLGWKAATAEQYRDYANKFIKGI